MEINGNQDEVQILGQENLVQTSEQTISDPVEGVKVADADKDVILGQKEETPAPEDKPKEAKEEITKTKTDKKEEKPVEAKKEEKEKPLEISFNGQKSETKKEDVKTPEEAPKPISEKVVLDYLKNQGIETDSISNLSKKESLPEAVAKFKEFHENTGRGLNDFYNLQKDWSKEPEDEVLKAFYADKFKGSTKEDLNDFIDTLKLTEEEEDGMSERDIKSKKLEYKQKYSEALSYMTAKSKEYSTPLGNTQQQVKPPTAEEIAKSHRPYWDARDKSLANLNDFNISVKDLGDIELPLDQEDKDALVNNTETFEAMIGRWQNKDGSMNTETLLKDNAWSHEPTRNKMLTKIIEQVNALALEKFSLENRNVKLDSVKQIDESITEKGKVLTFGGNDENNLIPTPLF